MKPIESNSKYFQITNSNNEQILVYGKQISDNFVAYHDNKKQIIGFGKIKAELNNNVEPLISKAEKRNIETIFEELNLKSIPTINNEVIIEYQISPELIVKTKIKTFIDEAGIKMQCILDDENTKKIMVYDQNSEIPLALFRERKIETQKTKFI